MADTLGIDVGGTFTDFFVAGANGIRTWKVPSTAANPAQSVLAGADLAAYGRVVHGSTVATNALLERRGPRTVLAITAGFRDLLEIRRQMRPSLYDLEPQRPPHVVASEHVIEVDERLDHNGASIRALTDEEVARVVEEARCMGAEAIAICLLFSYRNEAHEARLAAALRDAGLAVSASHEVLPEPREYERASTTAANAFLLPTVRTYLEELEGAATSLRVIHSGAGLTNASGAARQPVSMVTSGPAGGVLGALAIATAAGYPDIITLDMGGTSTDVALCQGVPPFRTATEVDGMAVHVPMVDIVTVGAGGGSIARIDAGGALRVGPESAGADPGPACYGRGTEPTVSDANLVLGRLRAEVPLAGSLRLDAERARAALASLGDPDESAVAVVEVVNVNMARALRRVSLERGHDPADFTLVAFGGAGPLQACALAEEADIARVLVPRHPGVLSALGMLMAPEAVERSHGVVMRLDGDSSGLLATVRTELQEQTVDAYRHGSGDGEPRLSWAGDLRYAGQAHELRVATATPEIDGLVTAFHEAHLAQFGYNAPDRAVELVTLRCRAEGARVPLPEAVLSPPTRPETDAAEPPMEGVRTRDSLPPGGAVIGPVVITQEDATTFVPAGWRGVVDAMENLVLERGT